MTSLPEFSSEHLVSVAQLRRLKDVIEDTLLRLSALEVRLSEVENRRPDAPRFSPVQVVFIPGLDQQIEWPCRLDHAERPYGGGQLTIREEPADGSYLLDQAKLTHGILRPTKPGTTVLFVNRVLHPWTESYRVPITVVPFSHPPDGQVPAGQCLQGGDIAQFMSVNGGQFVRVRDGSDSVARFRPGGAGPLVLYVKCPVRDAPQSLTVCVDRERLMFLIAPERNANRYTLVALHVSGKESWVAVDGAVVLAWVMVP